MKLKQAKNEILLEEYKKGNFSAFDVFYERNHKIIFCFLLKKCNKQELAEDLLQETFYRIHKYILKYNPNKNALNWALTIANNQLITAWHKSTKSTENIDIYLAQKQISPEEQIELKSEIEDILTSLNEEESKFLKDRLVEEKSFKEMSREYLISPVTVRKKFSRLLKRLKTAV